MATATMATSLTGGKSANWDRIAMPERPTPRRTRASTYLSAIQSKTAPKRVSLSVRRATLPSTRSRTAEMKRKRLPRMNIW